MKIQSITTLFLLLNLTLSGNAIAFVRNYTSGLFGLLNNESGTEYRGYSEDVIRHFIDDNFPKEMEWRETYTNVDNTHIHRSYAMYYQGRRVIDAYLKVDYNRHGFLEYASSTWEKLFSVTLPANPESGRKLVEDRLHGHFLASGLQNIEMESEPVIYLDSSRAVPAQYVQVTSVDPNHRYYRDFIVDESSGNILSDRNVVRFASDTGPLAWKVSPFANSNSNPPDTVQIDFDPKNFLKNTYIYVQREENLSSPALKDVDPNPSVPVANWTTNLTYVQTDPSTETDPPNATDYQCTGTSTDCGNQRIDAINVYYQLNGWRSDLQGYFNELGVTFQGAFSEPLNVIINSFTADTSQTGNPLQESNNAGFIPRKCTSDGGVTITGCIAFLKPAPVAPGVCGSTQVWFYDVAREAVVGVHEYTHFITDGITHMVSGGNTGNVGDAIHEGYSDYFGASRVSANAGRDVTLVGQYAFQNCTVLQRDVSVPRVYVNNQATQDVHTAGLTWASALWQLRKQMNRHDADMLALKSEYFLSQKPGFAETVEALVKADRALYGGAHVATIRELLYTQLKWIGGRTDIFRDVDNNIAEVGFKSCASVPVSEGNAGLGWLLIFGFGWVVTRIGRRFR